MPPLPDLRFDDDGKMILCFIFKISHLCNVSILISFSKGGMPPLPDLRLDDGEFYFCHQSMLQYSNFNVLIQFLIFRWHASFT